MQSIDVFRVTRYEFIFYAAILLVIVLWCRYKWNRRKFDVLAAKLNGPPSYPIIGTGLQFLGTRQQLMENIIKIFDKYGPEPFKIWMGTSFAIVISKPEDLQIVLNNSKALEKGSFYKFFKDGVGEGLFSAPVDKWRIHRRLINPVFNVNLIKQFSPIFNEKNKILIKNLRKEVGKTQPFDLLDYIAPTVFDTICRTMMGYNLNTQSNIESEFATALKRGLQLCINRVYKPWLYPDIIFSINKIFNGFEQTLKSLHKLPNQLIKEKKEVYAKNKITNNSNGINDSFSVHEEKRMKVFLDTLLELKDAGANLTDKDIKDEVITMTIGGTETSAITLCFCLLLLAIHPDIQDKVYDEMYDVFGDSDETITIEETYKLVYLEQVIKETLRLFPPGPLLLRRLQDDVKIFSGNHVLPKGTTCVISPVGTHRNAELYPNPLSFNPDNFNPENVIKRHKYSFIPFSGGPRACIGSKYAMVSMKVLLCTFLRSFSVHTDIKLSDIKLELDLLMRSVHGYPVTIRLRTKKSM